MSYICTQGMLYLTERQVFGLHLRILLSYLPSKFRFYM